MLLVNVSRLKDGRVQLLGTVEATDKHIRFPDSLSRLMVRAIPLWFPYLDPSFTYSQLRDLPSVVTMPNGAPLLISKTWRS